MAISTVKVEDLNRAKGCDLPLRLDITLVWEDTTTQEIVSTGVSIYVSADREKSDVQGRYILPADIALTDHLELVDGEYRPRPWASFRQMLSQRAHGEEVLFHDSERFVNAMLFRLRGTRGAPRLDAYRQAFRFGLRMKFDKSVDDIVRQQVLETRPTNIKRFKEVLHTFQEMAALVRNVQAKLDEAELIETDFADAHRRSTHSVSLAALAQAAELEVANEAVTAAEEAEGRASAALEAANARRDEVNRQVEAAEQHARDSASARDKHASHADAALLRESLAKIQNRLTEQRTGLHRSIKAIGRAIDAQIPGKLIANSDEATALALKDVHALLDGDNISRRDAVEATVRKALRAAIEPSDDRLLAAYNCSSPLFGLEPRLRLGEVPTTQQTRRHLNILFIDIKFREDAVSMSKCRAVVLRAKSSVTARSGLKYSGPGRGFWG
ncbi:hypothetical protein K6W78_02480 [Burkholderia cepacia]|uniref:hypothetical protein n=1 Tax=Burkholderia cepacia TaxID=292 RepID=UPI001C955EC7|nr:hypothetical protein [Burkholderia cepacia]MBY4798873.1 hypothetical protein [Burkholderia cepacia]